MESSVISRPEKEPFLWLEQVSRDLLRSEKWIQLLQGSDIAGIGCDLQPMEQALSQGDDYEPSLRQLAVKGKTPAQMIDHLLLEDIRLATSLLLPIFNQSEGRRGFVSLGIHFASLAGSGEILSEAQHIWKTLKQANLLLRLPATPDGLEVAQQCIAEGMNIHFSSIFSVPCFEKVVAIYLQSLEKRVAGGKKIQNLHCFASVGLGEIEAAASLREQARLQALKGAAKNSLRKIMGKAGPAIAGGIYGCQQKSSAQERVTALSRFGAKSIRLIWEGISAEDDAFAGKYLEYLEKKGTCLATPAVALATFSPRISRTESERKKSERASHILEQLAELGVNFSSIQEERENLVCQRHKTLYDSLLATMRERREAAIMGARQSIHNISEEESPAAQLDKLAQEQFEKRLWNLDPTLWKAEDAGHQEEIRRRLGWLKVIDWMQAQADSIPQFVEKVRRSGFTHALLCGMGGASLVPEVLRETFGITKGFLDLMVLDSTDPAAVLAAGARSNLENTLFVISSKSGSSVETSAFFQYFWEKLRTLKNLRAGENFVAITDPGTVMEQAARKCQFRHIFLNPPDIGGRYGALSYLGMVPAALMGINISRLLDRARRMALACGPRVIPRHNPALVLGTLIGKAALMGRDKLTFILSDKIGTFGIWIEQLISASTGKEGKGIIPIEDEPLSMADVYAKDRLFVYLRIGSKMDKYVNSLIKAGHPVVTLHVDDGCDLGGEFLRWEIATAAACHVLDVNPFDQPNVLEAKDFTREILTEYANKGRISISPEAITPKDAAFPNTLLKVIRNLKKGDYIGLNAFFEKNPRRIKLLQEIRIAIRALSKSATTLGFGPRLLHSTGQMHKGGPNNGVFLQFSSYDNMEVEVPGTHYTFDKLIAAQALGDFTALEGRHRRILLIDLDKDVEGGLRKTLSVLQSCKQERKVAKIIPSRKKTQN